MGRTEDPGRSSQRIRRSSRHPEALHALIGAVDLQIATDPDSIVLDSFAGSGTTAQAVLAKNHRGRRQPAASSSSSARTTPTAITAERVRRVINGHPELRTTSALREPGSGGTFSYFELGRPMQPGVAPRRLPPAAVGEARLIHLLHRDRSGVRPGRNRPGKPDSSDTPSPMMSSSYTNPT